MTRVSVFLSVLLLAATLGVAAQDRARVQPPSLSSIAQVSQPTQAGASAAKDSAQSVTTDDRAKASDASNSGSENLVKNEAPLPQTSTILPLLGFIGLGSLVAGLFARR